MPGRRVELFVEGDQARFGLLVHEHGVSVVIRPMEHSCGAKREGAYRCEKVPRPTSCPEMRISYPSCINDPNAIASAVAKSTLPSFSRLLSRFEMCRFRRECTFCVG